MDKNTGSITRLSDSHTRRRATCSSCRRRKTKCDNRQPQCSTCVAHKSQCHYDKPPSLAYVRSLEAQVEKLLREKYTATSDASVEDHEFNSSCISPIVDKDAARVSPFPVRPSETISCRSSPSYQADEGSPAGTSDRGRWISEICVNDHGEVSYHGPTSSFHEASAKGRSDAGIASPHDAEDAVEDADSQYVHQIKQTLVSNAAAQRHVEAIAVESISHIQNEIRSGETSELLKYHWCWIHPTFQFVYRPAFTRDMALGSQARPERSYFSETLLKVVLGHCSRFRVQDSQNHDSEVTTMGRLAQQAQFSLGMSISQPSSIPTIQALLQQSAREVAFANSSQAWLYSGIAFRMAIDLGIHLHSDKLRLYVKSLSPEDIEIRKRLFWSCYTWDKAISLYCGRMPAFTPPMETTVPQFMDDFTEDELWTPYYGNETQNGYSAKPQYAPRKGYMISSFTALCKLSQILSNIMLDIYGPSPEPTVVGDEDGPRERNPKNSAFTKISVSIQKWWTELPDIIRLTTNDLPTLSPPLHIVSLNLLYHTTIILLHRPLVIGATEFQSPTISRSYQICVTATAAIHDLLQLITSTFGYGHTTYLNCYSTYIATTIAVLQFQLEDETISVPEVDVPREKLDLKFFLCVLQRSAIAMPGVNRSVDIVKRHIQSIVEHRSKQYIDSLFPLSHGISANLSTSRPSDQEQSSSLGSQLWSDGRHITHPMTDTQFQTYSTFNLEGLPAFPGQQFNVGNDFTLDEELTDPEIRTALLGLDPHLILHHANSDWTYEGFYTTDNT